MSHKNKLIAYAEQGIVLPVSNHEKHLLAKYLIEDLYTRLQSEPDTIFLDECIARINKHEPLQYITGKAHFLDFVFYVDKNVLIPRPETEEVVLKAIELIKSNNLKTVLDIGTGSGCIPIAIKNKLQYTNVTAIDIDVNALSVAKYNAEKYNSQITFIELDFLNESNWGHLKKFDMIISNPPYISSLEKNDMSLNVLDFEPHKALFAGEDTLLFYRKIAKYAKLHNPTAIVICELNEYLSDEIREIFSQYANTEIFQDLQGKNRVLVAK